MKKVERERKFRVFQKGKEISQEEFNREKRGLKRN